MNYPAHQNTTANRLIWLTTVILFGVLGGVGGWILGRYYVGLEQLVWVRPEGLRSVIVAALTLGAGIVLARIGSWLANRFLIASLGHFHTLSPVDRVLGVVGVLLGLLFGVLVTLALPGSPSWWLLVKLVAMLVSAIIGMALFQGMRNDMLRVFPRLDAEVEEDEWGNDGVVRKLLDTNVIIDGRLADICKTGFIEGVLLVPIFVLEEVQYIADSPDALRRGRGRRGLDILNAMREQTIAHEAHGEVQQVPRVQVLHDIPPGVAALDAVDSKLVALAHEMKAAIITNDFNLNRVAELQEIQVLNINELAGALKPVVLPGEEMELAIVKEGKEPGQGVGYLDDGTMVVVADANDYIGTTTRIVISQLHQTVAGKMIFAEVKPMKGAGDDLFGPDGNDGIRYGKSRDRDLRERDDRNRDDRNRDDRNRSGNAQRSSSGGGVRRSSRA